VPIPDITSGAILLQPPTPILRGKFVYFLVGVCVCVCVCVHYGIMVCEHVYQYWCKCGIVRVCFVLSSCVINRTAWDELLLLLLLHIRYFLIRHSFCANVSRRELAAIGRRKVCFGRYRSG
jgi:hypothetical protein